MEQTPRETADLPCLGVFRSRLEDAFVADVPDAGERGARGAAWESTRGSGDVSSPSALNSAPTEVAEMPAGGGWGRAVGERKDQHMPGSIARWEGGGNDPRGSRW